MSEKEKEVAREDIQNTPAEQPRPQETAGANPETTRISAFEEAVQFLTQTKEGKQLLEDGRLLPNPEAEDEGAKQQPTPTTDDLGKILQAVMAENPTLAQGLQKVYEFAQSLPSQFQKIVEQKILPFQEQLELQKINEEVAEIRQKYPGATGDQIKTAMMIQKSLLESGEIDKVPTLIQIFADLRKAWGGNEEELKQKILADININKGQSAPITEGAGISSNAEKEPETHEDYARIMKERYGINVTQPGI